MAIPNMPLHFSFPINTLVLTSFHLTLVVLLTRQKLLSMALQMRSTSESTLANRAIWWHFVATIVGISCISIRDRAHSNDSSEERGSLCLAALWTAARLLKGLAAVVIAVRVVRVCLEVRV